MGCYFYYFAITVHPSLGAKVHIFIGVSSGLLSGLAFAFFVQCMETIKGSVGVNTTQIRIFDVEIGYKDTIKQIKEALSLMGAKIKSVDEKEGLITAKTGMSWESAGEILTINVRRKLDSKTNIHIKSQPLLWTTLADFGKNQENVEQFFNLMAIK